MHTFENSQRVPVHREKTKLLYIFLTWHIHVRMHKFGKSLKDLKWRKQN
mgnify:CR=1 FL=1